MTTLDIGTIAEISVTKILLQLGWEIFTPVGTKAYDLLGYKPEEGYVKIQIKNAKVSGKKIIAYTSRGNGLGTNPYKLGEIDYFVIWVEELQKAFMIKASDRLNPNKNDGSLLPSMYLMLEESKRGKPASKYQLSVV